MKSNRALVRLQALGLTPIGRKEDEFTYAGEGLYTCQCHGCMKWLAKGGLRIIRYARERSEYAPRSRSGTHKVVSISSPPRIAGVFCTDCALARKFVAYLPGREPKARPLESVPWAGKSVTPVRMVKYGSKWEAA